MEIKELERQEDLARQMLRKMEVEGALPKMTACTVKLDADGMIPVIRIRLRKLPLDGIHPLAKVFLVPMATSRIRFTVEKYAGVTIKTTVMADSNLLMPSPEWRDAIAEIKALRLGMELNSMNDEYMPDNHEKNPMYIHNFSRLAKTVDELVREQLAKLFPGRSER